MTQIIYLNGPSSAGKTTLTKALQHSFEKPYLHIGIDKIIDFMPDKINNWIGGSAPLGFSWEATIDPNGHPTYQLRVGPFAKKITRTLKDLAFLFASQGYNLIIDDVAFGYVEIDEWKQILKDFNVLYIGVACPLDVLESREKARGDRLLGTARALYDQVHESVSYDLELDTHNQTIAENIDKIKAAFENLAKTI